ncbi:RDD family protein [Dokdonia ponticola]|uniref:RDD family protein n=1 Tax=Dokdonia ponticola TaxID=2041041 RepID=A0ABV9HUV7_9FLAO
MTREEQLEFCNICKHQKFDYTEGIICRYTNEKATFQNECELFEVDHILTKATQKNNKDQVLTHQTVSAGTRFANYILDLLFLLAFNFLFGIVLGVIIALISPDSLSIFEQENLLIEYGLGFLCGMIYFTTLETLTGRTVAKFITQTKVVAENGEKANFDAILLRSLCRYIPFEAFSFLGDGARGWHDTLSKTRVISVK